jgi:hypothetical protein
MQLRATEWVCTRRGASHPAPMKYTLWLNGHLLGETRLEHKNPVGAQRMGGLRATAYGMELLPGLCGFLSAASALKKAMQSLGVHEPDKDLDRTMELMETIPEGARFSELVKALSLLELREASGERAAFHTLIITDVHELADLTKRFDADAELAQGVPRFVVSASPVDFQAMSCAVRGGTKMRVRMEPN